MGGMGWGLELSRSVGFGSHPWWWEGGIVQEWIVNAQGGLGGGGQGVCLDSSMSGGCSVRWMVLGRLGLWWMTGWVWWVVGVWVGESVEVIGVLIVGVLGVGWVFLVWWFGERGREGRRDWVFFVA